MRWPERLLASSELDSEPRLRWIAAALLVFFYWTFTNWYGNPALSTEATAAFNYVPVWPFEGRRWLLVFDFFWSKACLAFLALLSLHGLFRLFLGESRGPMLVLALVFLSKAYFYLTDLRLLANFHHAHLLFTLVFLISRSKLFFFRMALLLGYMLAAVAKLTPSWLQGEYLNSLPDALPLVPKWPWLVTGLGLGLLLWELAGPLLWLSKRRALRESSVRLFAAFHLFSITMVGYKYPLLMLPTLLAAFWRFDRPLHDGYRFARSHGPGWIVLALALAGGLWPFVIPGDARLTGEGRLLGFFMYDANRAADLRVRVEKGDRRIEFELEWPWPKGAVTEGGALERDRRIGFEARVYSGGALQETFHRPVTLRDGDVVLLNPALFTTVPYHALEPYLVYFYARELCRRYEPDLLAVRFRQRLDGHSERFAVVDSPDFCALDARYRPFWRNAWIRLPGPESHPSYRWR